MAARIRSISEAELDDMMARPFNPPQLSESLSQEGFAEEYWAVHARVMAAVSTLGKHAWSGEADFTMNDDGPLARSLAIELLSKKLWSSKFLSALRDALRSEPEAYRVFVHHAVLEEPEFYLLVTSDESVGFSPNPKIFSRFDSNPAK